MEFEPAPRSHLVPQTIERREGERTPLPRIVALIIENKCGEILCQRRASERHHGAWTVSAGGHQHVGENDQTTLLRETEEEIGVRPPRGTQRGLELHYPGARDARASWLQCYTVAVDDPILSLELDPREVSEVAWLHPEELLDPVTYLQPEFRFILETRETLKQAPFAVLWDMDDTLFSSRPHLLPVFEETTYRLTGIRPTTEQLNTYHGRTLAQFVEVLNAKLGVQMDAEEFRQLTDLVEPEIHAHAGAVPYSRLPTLIDELRHHGVAHAIGTSSESPRARRILDHLGLRRKMHALVGVEEVARPKPAPDVFLEGARRLGVPPERCIVFEDSLGGLRAAEEAGMVPVALDVGFHSREELELAHLVTPHYEDLTFAHLTELVTAHQTR